LGMSVSSFEVELAPREGGAPARRWSRTVVLGSLVGCVCLIALGMARADGAYKNTTALNAETPEDGFFCTIHDNAMFLGERGGKFFSTTFPVSKCNHATCSVTNVLTEKDNSHHFSHAFVASRGKGRWCLCKAATGDIDDEPIISYSGSECSPAMCFDEYTRNVEKTILESTPGRTGLSSTDWRTAEDDDNVDDDMWSKTCCSSQVEGCPTSSETILVPFLRLVHKLQNDPHMTEERAKELRNAANKQVKAVEEDAVVEYRVPETASAEVGRLISDLAKIVSNGGAVIQRVDLPSDAVPCYVNNKKQDNTDRCAGIKAPVLCCKETEGTTSEYEQDAEDEVFDGFTQKFNRSQKKTIECRWIANDDDPKAEGDCANAFDD